MTTPLRHLTLGVALGELARGVREQGTNDGARIREYLRAAGIDVPAPWCAAFVAWCSDEAARLHDLANPLDAVVREALVADYYTLAKDRGWLVEAEWADAGDLAIYKFTDRWDHIGFVVEPPGWRSRFKAVEGNTDDSGGREGVEVAIRDRRIVAGRVCFARWDEPAQEPLPAAA